MITVYYTYIGKLSDKFLDQSLAAMPATVKAKIEAYANMGKRRQRTAGALLAAKIKQHYKQEDGMTTSLAYAGELAVCAGSIGGRVGVDAELVKEIVPGMIEDYLTDAEQLWVKQATNVQRAFIWLWTRKEAVLKAAGTGIVADLQQIDVRGAMVDYEGVTYYLHELALADAYKACLATNMQEAEVTICELWL